MTGTGTPGATVEVHVDSGVVGATEVDEDGTWTLTPHAALECGENTMAAAQTDAAGNTSELSENVSFTFVCDGEPELPVTGAPVSVASLTLTGLVAVAGGVLMVRWRRGWVRRRVNRGVRL